MKRTVWASGRFLGASGSGVSKRIAVGVLGVGVSSSGFVDLEPLGEEEEGWEEDSILVGGDGDNHGSGLLGEPSSSLLLKVPGGANRKRFRVVDGVFHESQEVFVVVWQDVGPV